jgi:ATP-dependent 26S proteasome regulatory subunit
VAANFSPAVLVCEDIDRSMSKERDALMDRVLNALDGLDRSAEVLFIATTNDDSQLPAALLRPGRLDSFITFGPPDGAAALKLVRQYLGSSGRVVERAGVQDKTILEMELEGLLPASLREVASRSILHAIQDGHEHPEIQNVINAAKSVWLQQKRLEVAERPNDNTPVVRILHSRDSESDRLNAANGNGAQTNPRLLSEAVTELGVLALPDAR